MTSWRRTTVHLKKYVFFNSQLRLKLRKNVELFDSPLPRTGLRVPVRVDVRGRRARHGARALPSRRAAHRTNPDFKPSLSTVHSPVASAHKICPRDQ